MIKNCIFENLILSICQFEYKYFFNKANVIGVGMGIKQKNGIYLNQISITVIVSKKVSELELSRDNLIPKIYRGIITDVVEGGFFYQNSFTDRIRPVLGGYNISASLIAPTGSLGCLVKDPLGITHILSCNHVLALNNRAPIGTPILQPSIEYGGNPNTDIIATLSNYIPLEFITPAFEPPNFVDCAIAKVIDVTSTTSSIAVVGKPKGVNKNPRLFQTVKKVGFKTELTFGTIELLGASIKIQTFTGEQLLMQKQILCSKMSQLGDSGGVLLTNDNYVLGLVCGSSTSHTNSSLIDLVLTDLNVTLVTD